MFISLPPQDPINQYGARIVKKVYSPSVKGPLHNQEIIVKLECMCSTFEGLLHVGLFLIILIIILSEYYGNNKINK
jgi:hypothetical protein